VPTLYTTAISANGRKVLAVAKHLSLDIEVQTVNVYQGDCQSDWYRELNPWGKVPTLVDGDFVLWESNAILVYLSEAFGDFALSARAHRARSDILRWLFWEASEWQPTLTRVLAPRVAQLLFPTPGAAAAPVSWDDGYLRALMRVLEAAVDADGFVCGRDLSIADFALAGMSTYFPATGFPSEQHPSLAAWMQRMDELPAWASTAVEPWRRAN
jgi:glutathione S-transferase